MSACSPEIKHKPLTLTPWGELRICNHSPVVMGNIFKDSLDDILNSEYTRSWHSVPDHCSDCELWKQCYGGCRGACEQLGLSLAHVDPALAEVGGAQDDSEGQ